MNTDRAKLMLDVFSQELNICAQDARAWLHREPRSQEASVMESLLERSRALASSLSELMDKARQMDMATRAHHPLWVIRNPYDDDMPRMEAFGEGTALRPKDVLIIVLGFDEHGLPRSWKTVKKEKGAWLLPSV